MNNDNEKSKTTAAVWAFWGTVVAALITAIVTLIVAGKIPFLPPAQATATTVPVTEIQPAQTQPSQSITLSSSKLSSSDYGKMLYEDDFNADTGIWSLENGSQIQNGRYILASNTATYPKWNTEYTDFIFETEFQFINPPQSGWTALSAYLKYANPPCSGITGNCSDQVAVASEGIVNVWRPNGTNSYEQLLADTQIAQFASDGIHKLTVIVSGGEFRIFVDDTFVRSFNDSTYTSGIVVIGADATPVALDYVRIYALP